LSLGAGIRKHGFRKWYERELLKSHAHLALTFLCAVAVFGAFEAAMQFRGAIDQLIDAAAILIAGGVGVWSLRRYLYLLMHAEHVARQADCPQCGVYARFKLVEERSSDNEVTVCCRECAHRWSIADG
jgi:hypothetical protein